MHDYNPHITSNGLFWTIPVPHDSVSVSLGSGRAALSLTDGTVVGANSVAGTVVGEPLSNPNGIAFDSQGNLYGTTSSGGANKYGTVFELSPVPEPSSIVLLSFALIGLLLFFVTFGIIDFGLAFGQWIMAEKATQVASWLATQAPVARVVPARNARR